MEPIPGYNALMHELCVDLGWCGGTVDGKPMHVNDFLPEVGTVTAEQFVAWLFQADGVDPSEERWQKAKANCLDAFQRHLGSQEVDARCLRYSFGS